MMVQRKLLAEGKGCRTGAQGCEDCVVVPAGGCGGSRVITGSLSPRSRGATDFLLFTCP